MGMDGPIVINPAPYTVKTGTPLLGDVIINGSVSGLVFAQDHHVPGDHSGWGDLTNAQVMIQKTDGVFQWYIEAGNYSFPALGTPYTRSNRATTNSFGAVPIAYVKLAPNDAFSVQIGKLPTLIGYEYNFTFENANIERGLLWNQENQVSRGVQANYVQGPVTVNLSLNDGFYSNDYSYVTGMVTYVHDPANTIAFAAGGPTKKTNVNTTATNPILNNSSQYNLIWTHTAGQWTVVPYLQYTSTPSLPKLGVTSASTTGAAVTATYAFPSDSKLSGLSVPARFEYISAKGSGVHGANLLYGKDSNAWSVTVTPTYQYKIFYARAEASYVAASKIAPGAAFGLAGNTKTQSRILFETGVLF